MYEIEKNVPIPSRPTGTTALMRSMEIGDSFFMPSATHSQRCKVRTLAAQAGVKVVTRQEGGGVRVWRIA